MAMSKSHYEACARAIRRRYEQALTIRDDNMSGVALGTLLMLATDLSKLFEDDNISFDRTRFLKACGVQEPIPAPRRGGGVTAAVKNRAARPALLSTGTQVPKQTKGTTNDDPSD